MGLEALKGIEPVHVIVRRHDVHPVQVSQWKKEVVERLREVVSKPPAQDKDEIERGCMEEDLYAEIEQLKMEVDWLK